MAECVQRIELELELEAENAEMRKEYLAETKLLTEEEVHSQSGLKSRKKCGLASRWKDEGKLFAVHKGEVDLYPAFQFKDGVPRPVIEKILSIIGDKFSPWQIAFWFETGNGWLDGEEPQECLDNVDEVVLAAERLVEPIIG